ncbi:uncharacterized protein isoform X1 [Musca autumnalis]|uniref:uncharacterized protein isoform X1 n=1 Tax=Musca autumnalis TaxID=221902 RepID=UPI003CF0A027
MVNNKILDHIMIGGDPIQIISSGVKGDVMVFQFAQHANVAALKDIISSIIPPWENGKLKLVRKDQIPQLTKTSVFVRGWGSKFEMERMLEVFGRQNKDLDVKRSEVFHREEQEDGTLLVVGIDHLSMASLTKTKGRAFYISNAVRFKAGKAVIGESEEAKQNSEEVLHLPATMKRESMP